MCKSFSEFREGLEPDELQFIDLDMPIQEAIIAELWNVINEGVDNTDGGLLEALLTRDDMLRQVQRLDPKRAQRGDRTSPILIDSVSLKGNQGSTNGVRVVFKVPTQTDTLGPDGQPRRYLTFIDILDLQNEIFDNGISLKAFAEFLKTAKIRVYCSCPDFFWNGAKFNLGIHSDDNSLKDSLVRDKKYGYKGINKDTGEPYDEEFDVTKAPDIRDPNRTHILCKHLYACLKYLPNNATTVLSKAQKLMGVMLVNNPTALKKNGSSQEPTIKTNIVRPKVTPPTPPAPQNATEPEPNAIQRPVLVNKSTTQPETAPEGNESEKPTIDTNKALIGIQRPQISRKQEKREQRQAQTIQRPVVKTGIQRPILKTQTPIENTEGENE